MRLIDADKVYAEIKTKEVITAEYAEIHYDDGFVDGLAWCEDRLSHAPTVEAEPVRHGHWNSITNCSNAGVYCSVCGKKVWKEDYAWCKRKNKLRSDYCPHCGAKMDKKEHSDEQDD